MPKGQLVNPVDQDGKPVDITAAPSGGKAFALIPTGSYTAIVKKLEPKEVRAGYKGFPNPEKPDGKWRMEKVTPHYELVNENHTQINRGDLMVSYLTEDGTPVRPNGDGQSTLWDQARYLFVASGLIRKTGEHTYEYDFEYENITDRVVRLKVVHTGYVKATKKNLTAAELTQLFTDLNSGSYTLADYPALIEKYNEANDLTADNGLTVSNAVAAVFPLTADVAELAGYYHDVHSGAVYLSEASFHQYEDSKTSKSGVTPW